MDNPLRVMVRRGLEKTERGDARKQATLYFVFVFKTWDFCNFDFGFKLSFGCFRPFW